MKPSEFAAFLARVETLTPMQLDALAERAAELRTGQRSIQAIETVRPTPRCSECGSEQAVRNGHSRGLQRFWCCDCGKTFSNATGTPLSGLRMKDRFAEFAACMADGLTIRATAKRMGIAISTAFRWRHRFLAETVNHQARGLSGLVEADETYLRESCKGSRNLGRPARKRGGEPMKGTKKKPAAAKKVVVLVMKARGSAHVADWVMPSFGKDEAAKAAKAALAEDALLCTDGTGVYKQVEKDLGIKVEAMDTAYADRTRAGPGGVVYHIQGVNNYHERFKTWVNSRMRGVATKNLPSYLAWMRMQEWFKDGITPEHYIVSGLGRQIINT